MSNVFKKFIFIIKFVNLDIPRLYKINIVKIKPKNHLYSLIYDNLGLIKY